MLLPVFITDYWFSALLISEEKFTVEKTVFHRFPYNASEFTRKLSPDRLNKILVVVLGKKAADARQILISSLKPDECLFPINYEYKNLAKYFPFPVSLLDFYADSQYEEVLDDNEVNQYLNSRHYGFEISSEIVEKLVLNKFKSYVNTNPGDFLDIHTIGLLTPGMLKEKKSVIKKLSNVLADEIRINGYWRISLDDNASLVPLVAALAEQSIDPAEYFEKNQMPFDIRLIVASGVDNIEISRYEGKDKLAPESKKLKENSITVLEFGPDEKIHLSWNTKKSKFDGSMHGSPSGILIDNRERRNAK